MYKISYECISFFTDEEKQRLQEISQRVENMPTWKKEGWAILEEDKYYCGVQDTQKMYK